MHLCSVSQIHRGAVDESDIITAIIGSFTLPHPIDLLVADRRVCVCSRETH